MELEPELKAMHNVYAALADLDDEAKSRVIEWVVGKFSLGYPKKRIFGALGDAGGEFDAEKVELTSFKSVADLFAKAAPKSEADKVLVVGAYLQEVKGGGELTGREINKELQHLGHGVGNITANITSLSNRKPKLMIQTRKEGKTRQAQKKYKVTAEGLAAAKKMIVRTVQD